MNCARAGVENQNGCEIRTTSGTKNHHVAYGDGEGDESKKHEPLERSIKRVGYQVENMKSMQIILAAGRLIQIEQNSHSRGSKNE